MKTILVTGAAGFIGMHVTELLLNEGNKVVGVDNMNSYYDPMLKVARLKKINNGANSNNFRFEKLDLSNFDLVKELFLKNKFDGVIHLAAQAGVRYSMQNPRAYIDSNITGFINILEGIRSYEEKPRNDGGAGACHLVYASSSSVYGGSTRLPFSEKDRNDRPVSLYATTKIANELMAHTYSHLFSIPATGLRFFTVYGPWGRPDMAYFSFVKSILEGREISIFNNGDMQRDFTYIDDVALGILNVLNLPPKRERGDLDFSFETTAPHRVLNIGNQNPESLDKFIATIENALGIEAKKIFKSMQPGDLQITSADTTLLYDLTGFRPSIRLEDGIQRFVGWYKEFYSA
jgi:UDP-glucuronate 4-epimerase